MWEGKKLMEVAETLEDRADYAFILGKGLQKQRISSGKKIKRSAKIIEREAKKHNTLAHELLITR